MSQRKAAAVSMEEALADRAKERAKALGFSTFSAYVVQLIREDLVSRGSLVMREEPVQYQAQSKKPIKPKP